jgi:hypothetical protein
VGDWRGRNSNELEQRSVKRPKRCLLRDLLAAVCPDSKYPGMRSESWLMDCQTCTVVGKQQPPRNGLFLSPLTDNAPENAYVTKTLRPLLGSPLGTIPKANITKSGANFAAAFTRLNRVVKELARENGISVACSIEVEAPLFDGGSLMYRVNLGGGIAPCTLELDHKVFTAGNDYFVAFAVPQLEAAIEKLRPH